MEWARIPSATGHVPVLEADWPTRVSTRRGGVQTDQSASRKRVLSPPLFLSLFLFPLTVNDLKMELLEDF